MNTQEIEKIRDLVNTSPILSASERAEWLALLDVMNDKQLWELEKILAGGKQPAASSQQTTPSQPKVVTPPVPVGVQMPKLSHIMNLPNFGQGVGNRQQGTGNREQMTSNKQQGQQLLVQQKPSGFASKLKSIFQEKELPAGQVELEIEDGHRSQTIDYKPLIADQKSSIGQNQKSQASASKPFFPVREKPLTSPQAVKPALSALKVPLPPKPKTVIPAVSVSAPPSAPPKQPVIQSKPFFVSPTPDLPAEEHLPEKQPTPLPSRPAELSDPAINSLQDLAMFDLDVLNTFPLDSLSRKIKSLIGNYGYFEVIFNLEKSPAYKNYVATGLKLLYGQSNFESLSRGQNGDYLSKEEFEKFADLLAKIQTS